MKPLLFDRIIEACDEETFIRMDGFDAAVIGVCYHSRRLVYSEKKILSILRKQGLSPEDREEHYHFNIAGGCAGDQYPIICDDNF